jgi:predicted MFS family arabinose efflux permease
MARQLALAVGALINGILVAHAQAAVPVVIIAPLCAGLALRAATRRRNRTLTPTT